MSRRIKFLAWIPIFGMVTLALCLFYKSLKEEISQKKFFIFLFKYGLLAWLVISVIEVVLRLISYKFFSIGDVYISLISNVVGGYIGNFLMFTWVNKNYHKLCF